MAFFQLFGTRSYSRTTAEVVFSLLFPVWTTLVMTLQLTVSCIIICVNLFLLLFVFSAITFVGQGDSYGFMKITVCTVTPKVTIVTANYGASINVSQPSQTQVDSGYVGRNAVESLAYTFLSAQNTRRNPFADGIVAAYLDQGGGQGTSEEHLTKVLVCRSFRSCPLILLILFARAGTIRERGYRVLWDGKSLLNRPSQASGFECLDFFRISDGAFPSLAYTQTTLSHTICLSLLTAPCLPTPWAGTVTRPPLYHSSYPSPSWLWYPS